MNNLANVVLISVLIMLLSTESAQDYSSQNDLTLKRLNKPATVAVSRTHPPSTLVQDSPGGESVPLSPPPLLPFRFDHKIHSVSVTCHPSSMEIRIQSDLFQTGFPVNPEDLRLGSGCGVGAVSPDHFIIQVPLTDCSTRYWVTENALIYSNVLLYSPAVSPEGPIRSEELSIPVECRYSRRFGVDSDLVTPTWISHQSVSSSRQSLKFSLHIMSHDWRGGRESMEYFLGDLINLEVSVFTPQMELKVYVERCVATTTPDMTSHPAYTLIDNGCFTDGQQEGSRSRFLPRMHRNNLQLELDAFLFHQVKSSQIYITCVLRASLPNLGSTNRACSFINDRWRSADGDDGVCEVCDGDLKEVSPERPAVQNREESEKLMDHLTDIAQVPASANSWINTEVPNKVEDKLDLSQEASVGPLSLSAGKNEWMMEAPPIIRNRITSPKINTSRLIDANETGVLETPSESDVAEMFSTPGPGLMSQVFETQPPVMRDISTSPPPETFADEGTDLNEVENFVDLGLPVGAESFHILNPIQPESINESASLNSLPFYALQPQSDTTGV